VANYDRSRDPSADVRRALPHTRTALLLAAVAAIVVVLGIYSVSHSVGNDTDDGSFQMLTPRPPPTR
jgi:hypothetical protein